MKRVLIIGTSRGIGLGLVRVHLDDGWEVHATTRDGASPVSDPRVFSYQLDVVDRVHLDSMVEELTPVGRVIHNAGIYRATRSELLEVNAAAPIRVVETLIERGRVLPSATVSIMTSQLGARRGRKGSLGDYGDSKAALNDEFRRRAPEWGARGVVAVVIHPGWVRTDMGGSGASISVSESAEGILRVMDGLTPEDHGKFLTWDGREHPW